MADYWAKLRCFGTGDVPMQFVNTGETVSFDANFNLPLGGNEIPCTICFHKLGVSGSSIFADWDCVDAGTLQLHRRCECKDFASPGGRVFQVGDDCADGKIPVGPYPLGSGGYCYECVECQYPAEESAWKPDPSGECAGEILQTLQSTTSGCPDRTRPATGTKQPNWSVWAPSAATECVGTDVPQSRFDYNGCLPDENQTVDGTKTPYWSEWEPDLSTECVGTDVPQTQRDLNGCMPDLTRTRPGTKECDCQVGEWDWYPYPDQVCAGEFFTQEGYGYTSNWEFCGILTRQAEGTLTPNWTLAGGCENPVETDLNGCLPDNPVDPPECCSSPEGCCQWRIIEVGDNVTYQSGGPGTSPPSSWTPPSYSYEGYMELQTNCNGTWTTQSQWTTINGGPTQTF